MVVDQRHMQVIHGLLCIYISKIVVLHTTVSFTLARTANGIYLTQR